MSRPQGDVTDEQIADLDRQLRNAYRRYGRRVRRETRQETTDG